MEWGGKLEIGNPFFFRLTYIFIHQNSGQKCGEKYLKKKGFPISDFLSGILLNMINFLTNAQHILQSTEGKRKLRKKHSPHF